MALFQDATAAAAGGVTNATFGALKKGEAEPPVCYGTRCFDTTMWVSAVCCLVAAAGFLILGRRWKV